MAVSGIGLPSLTGTSGLFTMLGKCIGLINEMRTQAKEVHQAVETYTQTMEAAGELLRAANVRAWLASEQATRNSGIEGLRQQAWQILNDEAVRANMGVAGSDETAFFRAFLRMFKDGSNSIGRNTITIGSVTKATGCPSDGVVLVGKTLDGYQLPDQYCRADPTYDGQPSEFCLPETQTLTCIGDAHTGDTAGERFDWEGRALFRSLGWQWGSYGSGKRTQPIYAMQRGSLINGDFESWTAGVPDNWTAVSGGGLVAEETTAADVYRGSKAMRFTGDGATATIQMDRSLRSNLVRGSLTNRTRYCVSFRYKADSSVSAGTLRVEPLGTGFTAGASEKVSIAHGSLATSWTHQYFYFHTPAVIPSDFRIAVIWENTPTNAKKLWIDDLFIEPVHYHGGTHVNIVPPGNGSAWAKGNVASWAQQNDLASEFITFFILAFGVQPFTASSPTISDSLCDFTLTTGGGLL